MRRIRTSITGVRNRPKREGRSLGKKILIYFGVPLVVTGTLVAFYFSGVAGLQQIVAPRIRGVLPNTSREFGLLENVQNLVLLAMLVVSVAGVLVKKTRLEKAGLALLSLFILVVFLEEIDYGLHYYEYFNDVPWNERAEVRNWHNQGDRTDQIKRPVDIVTILLFVIAPILFANSRWPLLRFLTPDRYSILTLAAAFIIRSLAHGLEERGIGDRGVIHQNLSEFRELITYYVYFLYVIEIALRRRLDEYWLTGKAPASAEDDVANASTANPM